MVLGGLFSRGRKPGGAAETAGVNDIFNRGKEGGDTRIATASWLRGEMLKKWADDPASEIYFSTFPRNERRDLGTVYLGSTHQQGGSPIGWCDDRHLITVAGSRAGKGVSAILPNLHLYRGSVICIDPKGENATLTAEHRARELGQDVHILDPYDTVANVDASLKSTFDPLARLSAKDPEIIEKINLIADSMVVPSGEKDAHWDEMSRAYIAALIGHILTDPQLGYPRNLPTLRMLLRKGDARAAQRYQEESRTVEYYEDGETAQTVAREVFEDINNFEALLRAMQRNPEFDGMISGFAQRLVDMSFEERGSVFSSTDRHTRFLDGGCMQSILVKPQGRRKHLELSRLKTGSNPISIYLCLPTRYLATHARWLRLMINAIMTSVEISSTEPPKDGRMILMILDEFPVLGYMRTIESAIGYMAGYHIRLWAILQDLSQLKRDYPKSWETFLGNTGLQQFFANTDQTTLEYISKCLGETEVTRLSTSTNEVSEADRAAMRTQLSRTQSLADGKGLGSSIQISEQVMKVPLMMQDEIRILFSREKMRQVVLASGFNPIVCYRELYYEMKTSGALDLLDRRT